MSGDQCCPLSSISSGVHCSEDWSSHNHAWSTVMHEVVCWIEQSLLSFYCNVRKSGFSQPCVGVPAEHYERNTLDPGPDPVSSPRQLDSGD